MPIANALFTIYRIAFVQARKPYCIDTKPFTHKTPAPEQILCHPVPAAQISKGVHLAQKPTQCDSGLKRDLAVPGASTDDHR